MQLACRSKHEKLFSEIRAFAKAAQAELDNKTDHGRLISNTMTRSGLVLLCGYFEGALRDMATEFIDYLNDKKVCIEYLPSAIIYEHATVIMKNGLNNSFDSLLESLFANTKICIEKKSFAATDANPTVDLIDKMFARFGISKVIDKLTIQDFPEFKKIYSDASQIDNSLRKKLEEELSKNNCDSKKILSLIEGKWPPKCKRRRVGYIGVIDELLRKRNQIAHGEVQHIITPLELLETTDQIEKLSIGLTTILEERLYFITAS